MPSKMRFRFALGSLLALPCLPSLVQGVNPGAAQGVAVIDKPQAQAFDRGNCIKVTDGSFIGSWHNADGKFLTFTIGPFKSDAPIDAIPQSSAKYAGPGVYKNVLVKFSLRGGLGFGAGLSTVTVGPDGQHGRFESNDGKASGSWDCGRDAEARNKTAQDEMAHLTLNASSTGPYWDKRMFDILKRKQSPPDVMQMVQHILDLDRAGARYLSCKYGPSEMDLPPIYFWKDRVMVSMAQAAAISKNHKLLDLGDRAYRHCPATYGEAMRERRRMHAETEAIINRIEPGK